MRLVRVQVPEFRALKDVDITFEPEFTPQVFPLGSLNGGGKSTLLQLIFVLLSIIDDETSNNVNTSSQSSYFIELLRNLSDKKTQKKQYAILAIITLVNIKGIKITLQYLYGEVCDSNPGFCDYSRKNLQDCLVCFAVKGSLENSGFRGYIYIEGDNASYASYDTFDKKIISERQRVINSIKKSIFLIAPSNQNYLFSTTEERRLLFTSDSEKTYDQVIKRLKNDFPTFFTYDFINVLTEVFRLARDKDFKEKSETGVYGTHYDQLENTINSLFIDGKKIIPLTIDQKRHTKDSIQSMGFKLPSGQEIYPEDLSHGELKRLTIFILLKYYDIQDSIVLMDEIENGFHLDWQYTIVRDLVEWGKTNQYILATHSYELCTAVTPAHVKEITPNLIAK